MSGVVVAVDGSLQGIDRFTVLDSSGIETVFEPGPEATFGDEGPLSHLFDHLRNGEPVHVEYITRRRGHDRPARRGCRMRRLASLLVLGMLLAGCGAGESGDALASASAIVVSSDLAPGRARLLVGLLGPDGTRLGSPNDEVAIEIAPADRPDLRSRATGAFTWIIEGGIGLYRAEFQIEGPGQYVATVVPDGGRPLEPVPFTVNPETFAPGIGDLAPLTPTPTLSGNALEAISTDPDPDPSFYAMSLDEAVTSGHPTVAVFSTPALLRHHRVRPDARPREGGRPRLSGRSLRSRGDLRRFRRGRLQPGPGAPGASRHRRRLEPADRAVGVRRRCLRDRHRPF